MINIVGFLRNGAIISASEQDAENIVNLIDAIASNQVLRVVASTEGKIVDLTSEKLTSDVIIETSSNFCMTPKKGHAKFNLFMINILWGVYIKTQEEPIITID